MKVHKTRHWTLGSMKHFEPHTPLLTDPYTRIFLSPMPKYLQILTDVYKIYSSATQ
jgi:hypothetical protein